MNWYRKSNQETPLDEQLSERIQTLMNEYMFNESKAAEEELRKIISSNSPNVKDYIYQLWLEAAKTKNKRIEEENKKYREEHGFWDEFNDDLEETKTAQRLLEVLDHYNISYEWVDFPRANPVLLLNNGSLIDNFDRNGELTDTPELKKQEEWVGEISDFHLTDYVDVPNKSEEFWEGVSEGSYVYHGTTVERLDDIMREGLEPRDESRGLSNTGMGSAVFTSENVDDSEYYYDAVIRIDLAKMKALGIMPEIGGEEPLEEKEYREAIAYKIGLQNYEFHIDISDGLSEDTVVFYGAIPPECLEVIKPEGWQSELV